jgi:hypothetical protein
MFSWIRWERNQKNRSEKPIRAKDRNCPYRGETEKPKVLKNPTHNTVKPDPSLPFGLGFSPTTAYPSPGPGENPPVSFLLPGNCAWNHAGNPSAKQRTTRCNGQIKRGWENFAKLDETADST